MFLVAAVLSKHMPCHRCCSFLCAALAHQQDFDVCWCRGSVAETIFQPLIASIERSGGSIQGACT